MTAARLAPRLLAAGLVLVTVTLFAQKHGLIGKREPPAPPPPTPARLAFEAESRAAAAAAEAARRQAEAAQSIAGAREEETVLAEGPGRSETFGYCTACHNTALIRRSAFDRDQWDELMDWMTEKHGMTPLEGALRETIVNYLAEHYGPRQRGGGGRGGNPFLNPFLN
jgi:cytochrome c553